MLGAAIYGARAMRWEWLILLFAVVSLDPTPHWGPVCAYLVFLGHELTQGIAAGWMYWVFKKNAQRATEPVGAGVISTEAGNGVAKKGAVE